MSSAPRATRSIICELSVSIIEKQMCLNRLWIFSNLYRHYLEIKKTNADLAYDVKGLNLGFKICLTNLLNPDNTRIVL